MGEGLRHSEEDAGLPGEVVEGQQTEKEASYQKAVLAINALDSILYPVAEADDDDDGIGLDFGPVFLSADDTKKLLGQEKAMGTYDLIRRGLAIFKEKLADGKDYSLEALSVLNKLAAFSQDLPPFVDKEDLEECRMLSDDAKYIMYESLKSLDQEALDALNRDGEINAIESTEILLKEPKYDYLEEGMRLFTAFKEHPRSHGAKEFLKTREFKYNIADAAQQKIDYEADIKRGFGIEGEGNIDLAKNLIEGYGIDFEDALRAWQRSIHDEEDRFIKKTVNLAPNLRRMIDLDHDRPGEVGFLNEQCGMLNFDRYPDALLHDQYRKRKDATKPYGLMILAESDWNGAFSADGSMWEKLYEDVKDGYNLRILECASKQDLARGLIKMDKNYGKASFAFIGGHGTENSIELSSVKEEKLGIDDFTGKGVKKAGKFFKPNPTIVLMSCSTGKEGGIGQKMSEVVEGAGVIKIVAPNIPVSIQKIHVTMENDKIDFGVEYYKQGEKEEGATKKYAGGKNIT